MDIPFLHRETIERRAYQLCRDAFGELPDSAIDLQALLFDHLYERHGLAFYDDRPLGDADDQNILGVTYPIRNEIHVDRRLAERGHRGRYRFTVAHEIGHWVLHRPLFVEADTPEDDARLVTLQRDVDPPRDDHKSDYRPEEWQANQFAIYLLLNDPALQTAFEIRFDETPLMFDEQHRADFDEMRQFTRHLAMHATDEFRSLVELFELSAEATAIALEERGYVVGPDEGV